MPEKFYITTAIAYVNAKPHMGHALEFVLADVISRYKRLMGSDTYYLTGTDEHGTKIYNTALAAGKDVQDFVDENAQLFKELGRLLNLSNDGFIRTSDKNIHWPACQKLWNKLVNQGDIYEKEYEGLYCEGCEAFMNERDLIDGHCPHHKKPPTLLKETNYFFKLSKHSARIVHLIESGQVKILPENRKQEFLNLAKEGLHDVSFSRPKSILPWGVEVPNDPSQVMYVWCDALTNYISGIGYHQESDLFKKYWPADLHVIGKDIVRFHAGIWVGMLLSAGIPVPKGILVHGFLTHNGEKMSKSLGNVVDPVVVVEQYGTDALRYYFTREIPCGRDGDFNDQLFVERYNADLANNLGNLVNRVHALITRNEISDFNFEDEKEVYKTKVDDTWKKYVSHMNQYQLHEAVFYLWRLVDFANKKMEEEKPWTLLRTDPPRGKTVLCNLLEVIRHISIMISPIIPHSATKIRMQLGLPAMIDPSSEEGWGAVKEWKRLGEAEIIFPRI